MQTRIYPARNGKQQRCVYDRKDGGIPASEPDHGIQRAFWQGQFYQESAAGQSFACGYL